MAKSPVIDPQTKALLEDVGDEIVRALDGKFFEVDGAPKAVVKMPDKTFKQKVLMPGWNFAIAYSYVGQRGQLIFGLSPEDAQEYEFVEFAVRDLDGTFPLVGAAVAEAFKIEGEKLTTVIDTYIARRANQAAREIQESKAQIEDLPTFGMF